MATTLTDNQVELWRSRYEEFLADAEQVAYYKQLDERRLVVQQEMNAFLAAFLSGEVGTAEFRATFDRKTRKDWNPFGLKGMSGAMFLNILVNQIPNQQALANQLKTVLRVPKSIEDAQEHMTAFIQFLETVISSRQVTKRQLQPARSPFFISAWWHIQVTEEWPVFYPRIRQALEFEVLYTSSQDPVRDYFTFREIYLSLAAALRLKSWQLEHVFSWYNQRDVNDLTSEEEAETMLVETSIATAAPEIKQHLKSGKAVKDNGRITAAKADAVGVSQQESEDEQAVSGHAYMQWLLAKIGRKLGCRIWIAANDQNKIWNNERLGDLSLKALPTLGMDPDSQQIISLIDVLWLKGNNAVAAAFEIEHTTSIYSGLLRISDLIALSPNINFPLYIVTPENRLDKVRRELSRPTFQILGLHKRCGFFAEEKLMVEAEAIMRWANQPSVIEKLAFKVEDAEE
ncbi:MAG TPA: hypothetical protein VJ761_23040 [Ktedonobacteraceae bacterium]|nr:hypothetical protein [Ktedonobacteraceae bacterium]